MSLLDPIHLPTSSVSSFGDVDHLSTPGTNSRSSATWTPIEDINTSSSSLSRKRSRDETNFDTEGEYSYFSHPSLPAQKPLSTPAPIPEEEPIYGEGMVLISPSTGQALSAESQTGTWYEEREAKQKDQEAQRKLQEEAAAVMAEESQAQFRPKMPVSRKSIRLSQSSIRAALDESGAHNLAPASPPKSASDRSEVDEATIALGIGWTKIGSEDPDLQAAARGWAKYIENHYRTIHGAEILLKSRSLNAYLVGSQEGFLLFTDDLLEGKLVARSWENTLHNLKSQPVQFESEQILRAERTPGPNESQTQIKLDSMNDWAFDQNNGPGEAVVNEPSGGMDLD